MPFAIETGNHHGQSSYCAGQETPIELAAAPSCAQNQKVLLGSIK